MHQYVTEPTHKCGKTLDHVVCRPGDDILSSHSVSSFRYGSDHNMIHCEINIAKPVPDRRVIKSRSYKDLDMTLFEADLKQATDCVLSEEDPNVQADIYNTKVRAVLDKHCPEQSRSCKLIKNPKWYSEEITVARRDRRRLERKWRKTRTAEDHDKFLDQHATVNKLIKDSKIEYFRATPIDNADAKTMYNTLNTLLNSSAQKLPSCDSNVTLSNKFVHYVTDKVCDIRSELDAQYTLQSKERVCSNSNVLTSSRGTSLCNHDYGDNSDKDIN